MVIDLILTKLNLNQTRPIHCSELVTMRELYFDLRKQDSLDRTRVQVVDLYFTHFELSRTIQRP